MVVVVVRMPCLRGDSIGEGECWDGEIIEINL